MNTRTHALCDVIQEAAARQHEAKQAVRLLEASVGKAKAAPEDAAVTCAAGDPLGCVTIQVGHGLPLVLERRLLLQLPFVPLLLALLLDSQRTY